ncbi:MAG: Ig-like domain-containing protein [bacterium]
MKDEGIESKDINSVSSSSEFKVTSVDPADGETSVSTTNISFTFNKSLNNYGAGNSNDCNQQLFYLSTDSNFSTCVGWNSSCSGFSSYTKISGDGKTLTLCTTSLNSSTTYY